MARLRSKIYKQQRETECSVKVAWMVQPSRSHQISHLTAMTSTSPMRHLLCRNPFCGLDEHMGSKAGNTPEGCLRYVQLVRLSSP